MYILILYYSQRGSVAEMAHLIARGVEKAGLESRLRTVPPVSAQTEAVSPPVPESGAPYARLDDLAQCAGLALGSPSYFGHMASAMKYFWEKSSGLWMQGALLNKPACVFTASSSMHGGQESTLLSMMIPLLHHGMILTGLPYVNSPLIKTQTGGTPYGASHFAGANNDQPLSEDEKILCKIAGQRLAELAKKINRA